MSGSNTQPQMTFWLTNGTQSGAFAPAMSSLYGTRDIVFAINPDSTAGFGVIESYSSSLYFSTGPSNSIFLATNRTARANVDSSGNFWPNADNAYTCGKSGNRWSAIWAANGTIQTSDLNAKTEITPSALGLDFINALKPVSYKFKVGGNLVEPNEVDPTNPTITPVAGKRLHFGLIAQDVKDATPAGIDFGGWIQVDIADPNSEQGLRYDEFIAPLIKAIQELKADLDTAKARIAALEGTPQTGATGPTGPTGI